MTYAEVFDVEAGFRALSKDEQERCSALLSEAAKNIDGTARETLVGALGSLAELAGHRVTQGIVERIVPKKKARS